MQPGAGRMFMPFQAYGLSKLAQIVYSRELALRLEQAGVPVLVHAVHPGLTADGMTR